jgi:hypothetical protein
MLNAEKAGIAQLSGRSLEGIVLDARTPEARFPREGLAGASALVRDHTP